MRIDDRKVSFIATEALEAGDWVSVSAAGVRKANRTLAKLEQVKESQTAWVVLGIGTRYYESDTVLGVFTRENLAIDALELFKADTAYSSHYHGFNIEKVVVDDVSGKTK